MAQDEEPDGKKVGGKKRDYEVGYGKPPKHSQFQKNQSGNPIGKKRGTKSFKTSLAKELGTPMTLGINGKQVTGSRQQLMLQILTARAAAGDPRATKLVLELFEKVFGFEEANAGRATLSAQDQQLLDALLADFGTVLPAAGRADEAQTQAKGPDDAHDAEDGTGEAT